MFCGFNGKCRVKFASTDGLAGPASTGKNAPTRIPNYADHKTKLDPVFSDLVTDFKAPDVRMFYMCIAAIQINY